MKLDTMDGLLQALRRLRVETGGLACLGCGHEHNCGVHGCAIIRKAMERLLGMTRADHAPMTVEDTKDMEYTKTKPDQRLAAAEKELHDANSEWISVKDRLPENEKDVLIAYKRKGFRGDVYSCVGMAFHTDGQTNTEDSIYVWKTDCIDMDYDEDADAYIIPEGWWETVDFGEEFSAVDMSVTHWMPLPEPPEEGRR